MPRVEVRPHTNRLSLRILTGPRAGEQVPLPSQGLLIGRAPDCDLTIGCTADGTSRRHARIRQAAGQVCVDDLQSRNGVFVNGRRRPSQRLQPGDLLTIGQTTFQLSASPAGEERKKTDMERTVASPPLYTHAQLHELLRREIALAQFKCQPLSLALVRLDSYHELRALGQERFDEALLELAYMLRERLRQGDLSCRFATDSFLVLLPETDAEAACRVAERVAWDVSQRRFSDGTQISCSAGVASLGSGPTSVEQLIVAADRALARARREGQGEVCEAS